MKFTEKQIKLLEIYFKAVANRKRIKILILIKEKPNLTVFEIAERVNLNYQTIATHTQRLEQVGFIYKKYRSIDVMHSITPKGKSFLKFFKDLLK